MNSLAQCVLEVSPTTERARELYERALRLDPTDFETNFNMGIYWFKQRGDRELAVHFLKSGAGYESSEQTLYNIAFITEESGDLESAQKWYRKLLEGFPHNEKAIINLGVVLDK